MGATVSICNLTNLIINVSIGHVTPLYFENYMTPNMSISRNVGKVWFTVTAVQWVDEKHEFSPGNSIGPILSFGMDAVSGGANLDPKSADGSKTEEISRISKAVANMITTITGISPDAHTGMPVGSSAMITQKAHIFAKDGMKICIKGGPPKHLVTLPKDNKLNKNKQVIKKLGLNDKPYPGLRVLIDEDCDCPK